MPERVLGATRELFRCGAGRRIWDGLEWGLLRTFRADAWGGGGGGACARNMLCVLHTDMKQPWEGVFGGAASLMGRLGFHWSLGDSNQTEAAHTSTASYLL